LVLIATACGPRNEFVVSTMTVDRAGWDTLRVAVDFEQLISKNKSTPIVPDSLVYYVFDGTFDTLYAGSGAEIAIPDAELGDNERLLIEVCGQFSRARVCEQEALNASTKRVVVEHQINYPEDNAYERGSYDLNFALERQQYGNEDWETIPLRGGMEGYLMAYVSGKDDAQIRVPIRRNRAKFNLAPLDHHKDFKYYLNTALMDEKAASVFFDVYVDLRGVVSRIASVEKHIELKTEDQRLAEVGTFVDQAVEQLLQELRADGQAQSTHAFVNAWSYNSLKHLYEVEVELNWQEGRRFGDWYEVVGILSVLEDGSTPSFELVGGNRRAERRWHSYIQGEVFPMHPLTPEGDYTRAVLARPRTW
jgi:hypothetical protein